MNISENKRVVALSAVFAIAFGGVMYYGYDQMQQCAGTQKELKAISERFQDYENAEVPPTAANRKEIKAAFDKVTQVNKELQTELDHYKAYCNGDGKKITAPDFQRNLLASIGRIEALAKENNTVLDVAAADLGLSAWKSVSLTESAVPYRSFQLKAVERVAETLIKSGAPRVDKIFCATPPDAEEGGRNRNKAEAMVPLRFEVAFRAKRGVLPQVINGIVSDKDFLLTITGVSVVNEERPAERDAYVAPATAPEGENLGGDAAASAEGPRMIAVRKTGSPDETARVHLNLQVLYFNPAKTK